MQINVTQKPLPVAVAFVLLTFSSLCPAPAADSLVSHSGEQLYLDRAGTLLAAHDTAAALHQLDTALERSPDAGRALIDRGRLRLALGNPGGAREDFGRALFSDSAGIRYEAHLGLGHAFRKMTNRNWDAIREYRQALRYDPASREALYSIAMTGFDLAETSGYRLASEMLVELICIDPEYRDAYHLWREKIRDQTNDELHTVDSFLSEYLEANPGKAYRWLDLAWDRFRLHEIDRAWQALDKLETTQPAYKIPEQTLLRARILLERGDTLGFERTYHQALAAGGKYGGFERMFVEVQPIFTPAEKEKWYGIKGSKDVAVLFRRFWKSRDPDPITFRNERLVNHYLRLREAETYYRQQFPHSLFQTSREYFMLLSPGSNLMEYDPEIFRTGNRQLPLDQRGMLYIRHGPPERINHPDMTQKSNPSEIWYYEDSYYVFERLKGAGDYLFIPLPITGAGDVKKALATDSFRDQLPRLEQEYYASEFMDEDGNLELEFYQSVPISGAAEVKAVQASAAVFDTTWLIQAIDTSSAFKAMAGNDSLWIAVNRIVLHANRGYYALNMDLSGFRVAARNVLDLNPYSGATLELSGIILGTAPAAGQHAHSRNGIKILPRPSLEFVHGEVIRVYFEIYGLRDNGNGERAWRERITVSLADKKAGGVGGFFAGLAFWSRDRAKSLSFDFQRNAQDPEGRAAEYFDIDSAELTPGRYRLQIRIEDELSGERKEVSWEFTVIAG
ncbi:MAG: hypothetical protein FVQ81_08905 [Candidatus Glassbacteria bacterium]|nr:hypothetical protein [Candidatus Glassbacteria bacterium]